MLISMPTQTTVIFGVFQVMVSSGIEADDAGIGAVWKF